MLLWHTLCMRKTSKARTPAQKVRHNIFLGPLTHAAAGKLQRKMHAEGATAISRADVIGSLIVIGLHNQKLVKLTTEQMPLLASQ